MGLVRCRRSGRGESRLRHGDFREGVAVITDAIGPVEKAQHAPEHTRELVSSRPLLNLVRPRICVRRLGVIMKSNASPTGTP
jgi:hypothetical protein